MKKKLLALFFTAFGSLAMAQSAPDFTAADCNGTIHNLYTELDSGKVIVLCWVMPCGSCIGGAKTSYNVSQSFSNPNVVYYLLDDNGNTSCTSLNTWANNTAKIGTSRIDFSNADIIENNYGGVGMPHVVVLGGTDHTTFFNGLNGDAGNSQGIQDAINEALGNTSVKNEQSNSISSLQIFPNPVINKATVNFNLSKSSNVTLEVFNLTGKLIKQERLGKLAKGENKIELDMANYITGMYLVKMTDGDKSNFINLMISR